MVQILRSGGFVNKSFSAGAQDEMGWHRGVSKMMRKFVCCDSLPGCTSLGTFGVGSQYVFIGRQQRLNIALSSCLDTPPYL